MMQSILSAKIPAQSWNAAGGSANNSFVLEEAGGFKASMFGHLLKNPRRRKVFFLLHFLMFKAVVDDAIASDGETVVLSLPASRVAETETINPKKTKIRKIADLRMNAEELWQMRGKIAKAVKECFLRMFSCTNIVNIYLHSHSTRRPQLKEWRTLTKTKRQERNPNQLFSRYLLSGQ